MAISFDITNRYQKLPATQKQLFRRISDNYVDLIFSDMDFRYRDTFLTKFAGELIEKHLLLHLFLI